TVNIAAVVLTFVSSTCDAGEASVLSAVQLLWVNLIMDTLAALATERPTPDLLNRPPEPRSAPLVSRTMCKFIAGQALLQVAVNLSLLFYGPYLFGFDDEIVAVQKATMRTIVFTSFVFMQVFNQINCRRIDNGLNPFKGMFQNPAFVTITAFIVVTQILLVTYGGAVFGTEPLTVTEWLVSVLIGLLAIPWGTIIRLLPLE
ncbi:cation-transporting P-type ATPase, partial [Blyttiomyces helicus]